MAQLTEFALSASGLIQSLNERRSEMACFWRGVCGGGVAVLPAKPVQVWFLEKVGDQEGAQNFQVALMKQITISLVLHLVKS